MSSTSIATASLANDSLLSQCADFIETMLHRFLKAESEKPTQPTPAELQPAVNTLWRLSTIRKNLSQKPSPSRKPLHNDLPVHKVHNVHAAPNSYTSHPETPNLPDPVDPSNSIPSVSSAALCAPASRASNRNPPLTIRTSPNPSPPPATASPPQFRYPPPKRTRV